MVVFKPTAVVLAIVAVFGIGAVAMDAQSSGRTASVSGVIMDETKVVIQGVTVTATNPETGVIRTAITDELGLYRLPALQPGKYQLTFELPGFDTVKQGPIALSAGKDTKVSAELKFASCGRI